MPTLAKPAKTPVKRKPTDPKVARKKKITKLLTAIETSFKKEAPKATLADFIRLTQLERELDEEQQPAEIVITWAQLKE
jgi:hypothetical protein